MRERHRLWRLRVSKPWSENRYLRLQRGSLALLAPSTSRFDTDVVVDGSIDPLLAAKVSLSCLNRHVTKQELDLFELTARCMAQLRAGPPQIMWCKL